MKDFIQHKRSGNESKTIDVLAQFSEKTNPNRVTLLKSVLSMPFVHVVKSRVTFRQNLENMQMSKFVLSPQGAGIDCLRNWEALLVGTIPIITDHPVI